MMQRKRESREHAIDSRPEFAMVIQRLYSCVLQRRAVLCSIPKTPDTEPQINPNWGSARSDCTIWQPVQSTKLAVAGEKNVWRDMVYFLAIRYLRKLQWRIPKANMRL